MTENKNSSKIENVLILQGGGSLGAYECGVYKTLAKHNIDFDVIVGTSIGAINASVISGSKSDDPAISLEEFWLELSETITAYLPEQTKPFFSALYATIWGNPNVVYPIYGMPNPWMLSMTKPFLYDNLPLKKTLSKFVDFNKINGDSSSRLIVTSVDIQKGTSVIFDNKKNKLDVDHIIASAGYPFYGISWTEKDNKYLWDGSLLSNTPLREAIDASPKCDKKVYIVSLFPREHMELPENMSESWHRARDIMHSDKTEHNVRMSKIISRYLVLLKKMHGIIEDSELTPKNKDRFNELQKEYEKLASQRGAIIRDIIRIERQEESHFLLEDTDFSLSKIKSLIKQGESDAEKVLVTSQK
jgi:NTE family protein